MYTTKLKNTINIIVIFISFCAIIYSLSIGIVILGKKLTNISQQKKFNCMISQILIWLNFKDEKM